MGLEGTGLVLEGGGFRGIYTAAVLDVFHRGELFFPYIVGVSAGAAYGVSYVSRQLERNLAVNRYVSDSRYCGWRHFVKNGNFFNWDFIYHEIPGKLIPFSFHEFNHSGTRMQAVLTNCSTGKAAYFDLNGSEPQRFCDLLTATSSLPFISRMKEIDGTLYMDGGIADAIPVRHAFSEGVMKAVVVLTRPPGYRKRPSRANRLAKWVYRKYPHMVETFLQRAEGYNRTLDELEALEKEGKVFLIRPEKPLPVSRIENNPEKLKNVYDIAIRQMEEVMTALQKWLS